MGGMKDGGPAFARPISHDTITGEITRHPGDRPEWAQAQDGMSLRDYFAASVDIPWGHARALARTHLGLALPTTQQVIDCRAALRYAEADAMLKAREKS